MPAQKRPFETATPPPSPPPSLDDDKADDSLQGSENLNKKLSDNITDSDESSYSSDEGEQDEFIVVKLGELRKEVQCPICLGIIRKTRTVMECLHRFCRECIDKSMRLGNNECPACRTHCASRRSLRDDPNYDALIAALYPDIDKYEEEELAFHEEEKARNKQIQASISQTFLRQAEALGKRRTSTRVTAGTYSRRQGNYRSLRGRRNNRVSENLASDEEEVTNGSKDSSSADDRPSEVKSKRYKRWGGARTSQQSSGAKSDDNDNDSEANRDLLGGLEILAWGRGGMRSNTRHGGLGWANGKLSRNNRISKLIDHLHRTNESDEELKISITLLSFLEAEIPSQKRPFLCCSALSSVKHLCQYIAMQASMEADKIEILTVKDFDHVNNSACLKEGLGILNPCPNELQLLNEDQTFGEIFDSLTQQNLVLTYRLKAEAKLTLTDADADADAGEANITDAGEANKITDAAEAKKTDGGEPKITDAGVAKITDAGEAKITDAGGARIMDAGGAKKMDAGEAKKMDAGEAKKTDVGEADVFLSNKVAQI